MALCKTTQKEKGAHKIFPTNGSLLTTHFVKGNMDRLLVETARYLYAENLFETVRKCYCEANKEYLEKQIQIASEYLTDEQKVELRSRGINV